MSLKRGREEETLKKVTFPQNSEESKNVVINCVYYEIEIPRSFMEQYNVKLLFITSGNI